MATCHRRPINHGGGSFFESIVVKNGVDPTSVEGAANIAYAIPNIEVELATTKTGVPVLWWRVVGTSHTTFAVEAFIDEAAHVAGKDAFDFRRESLEHELRMKAVLELAAEKAHRLEQRPVAQGQGPWHCGRRSLSHLCRSGGGGHRR